MEKLSRSPRRYVKFTRDEDQRLTELVIQHGPNSWAVVAAEMKTRNSRQCRERWTNYINPSLLHDPWTPAEEALLEEKFAAYGTQWFTIASFFTGRSKNEIKYHWLGKQRYQDRLRKAIPASGRREIGSAIPEKIADESQTSRVQRKPCLGMVFPDQCSDGINWDYVFPELL
jgi:hypothetical protein